MKKNILLIMFATCLGAMFLYANVASGSLTALLYDSTLRPGSAVSAYGIVSQPTFTDNAGSTTNLHPEVAAMYANMTLTTLHASDAIGVRVPTFAAVGTSTTRASGIKVAPPTAAANNYGVWIEGTGSQNSLRVDGRLNFNNLAAPAGASLNFLCIDENGVVSTKTSACQ